MGEWGSRASDDLRPGVTLPCFVRMLDRLRQIALVVPLDPTHALLQLVGMATALGVWGVVLDSHGLLPTIALTGEGLTVPLTDWGTTRAR